MNKGMRWVIVLISLVVVLALGITAGWKLARQVDDSATEADAQVVPVEQKPIVQVSLPFSHAHDSFEEDLHGWEPREGEETLSLSSDAVHSGRQSMRIADRAHASSGAVKDITAMVVPDSHYKFRAWVKLAADGAETIKLMLQSSSGESTDIAALASGVVGAEDWALLEGDFEYEGKADELWLYLAGEQAGVDFYIDDVLTTRVGDLALKIEEDIPALKDVFEDAFILGTAFTNDELTEPDMALIVKHFSSVTPGNALKWDSTEPSEGVFRWENSDEAVRFAEKNELLLRGHTLVWHSQTPQWVFYDDNKQLVTKEVLYARMKHHIDVVMGRYQGKMVAWDVVNEVIDENEPDGLRRSLWYEIAGEEYIEKAFEYARAADPDVKLYINDYNTEVPAKAEKLHALVKRLKDKGVPIDGVGHQFHTNIEWPSMSNLEHAITRFSDLDVEQQVTELDIDVHSNSQQRYETFPEELAARQAERYRAIFEVLRRNAELIDSVTLWGKDDGHTWLTDFPVKRNNWPLLFDERLRAKEAYWAIVNP